MGVNSSNRPTLASALQRSRSSWGDYSGNLDPPEVKGKRPGVHHRVSNWQYSSMSGTGCVLDRVQPIRSPALSDAVELGARKADGLVSQRSSH